MQHFKCLTCDSWLNLYDIVKEVSWVPLKGIHFNQLKGQNSENNFHLVKLYNAILFRSFFIKNFCALNLVFLNCVSYRMLVLQLKVLGENQSVQINSKSTLMSDAVLQLRIFTFRWLYVKFHCFVQKMIA